MKFQLDKESFLKFFNINDIDIKEKSFLCAVSGGVDSTAVAVAASKLNKINTHIFQEAYLDFLCF